jgi:uncharacterized protein YbjT (DUF2867 family)
MEEKMKIVLIGSSGMLGQALLEYSDAKSYRWVGVSRRPTPLDQSVECRSLQIDLDQEQSEDVWRQELNDVDMVINCLGIIRETRKQHFSMLHDRSPRVIFSAAQKAGVKHIIQVSALGAEQPSEHIISEYHRSKQAADRFLNESGQSHTVLYPGMILSPRGASTRLFLGLASLPLTPYPAIQAQLQPVALQDVVESIYKLIAAVARQEPLPKQLIVVGEEKVSLNTLLDRFKAVLSLNF